MTSEWMADALMREWACQALPRSQERTPAGAGEAEGAGEAASALERAKEAFRRLSPAEREGFRAWLARGAAETD